MLIILIRVGCSFKHEKKKKDLHFNIPMNYDLGKSAANSNFENLSKSIEFLKESWRRNCILDLSGWICQEFLRSAKRSKWKFGEEERFQTSRSPKRWPRSSTCLLKFGQIPDYPLLFSPWKFAASFFRVFSKRNARGKDEK